jgi:hypothetical protein
MSRQGRAVTELFYIPGQMSPYIRIMKIINQSQ